MGPDVTKTPDEYFSELPGYPYLPRFVTLPDGINMHYVDQGPKTGWPVLLLHGVPTWSYLYRHIIPICAEAGLRVIAPDLVGFGRSDKPTDRKAHTYAQHVSWLGSFVRELDLKAVTLVGHDWGGMLGFRLLADMPDRFRSAVATNTGLPNGTTELSEAFRAWQKLSQEVEELDIGRVVAGGCRTELNELVRDAYDAPFPDESYKAAAREFPQMVPTSPEMPGAKENNEAWEVLKSLKIPILTVFSDGDRITTNMELPFQEQLLGAKDQDHAIIEGAGHFLQEDRGAELAHEIINFVSDGTVKTSIDQAS